MLTCSFIYCLVAGLWPALDLVLAIYTFPLARMNEFSFIATDIFGPRCGLRGGLGMKRGCVSLLCCSVEEKNDVGDGS